MMNQAQESFEFFYCFAFEFDSFAAGTNSAITDGAARVLLLARCAFGSACVVCF